jgi:hypothetical protein
MKKQVKFMSIFSKFTVSFLISTKENLAIEMTYPNEEKN